MKKSFWIFLLLLPLLLVGCSEKQNAVAATVSGQMNYSEQTIAAVQKLTDGNTAAFYQLFDDNMKKEMSEQDLQALWNKTCYQYGAFQYYLSEIAISSKDGNQTASIPCIFENGTLTVRLTFNKEGAISGFYMTEGENVSGSPRLNNDIEISFGTEDYPLSGSLTLPEGSGPFPVVILVQGSGAFDRNEQIGPNVPFLDLAEQLAQQGIAVLRYDNRSYLYEEDVIQTDNWTVYEETIDDVAAAVAFLQTLNTIKNEQIYIAGHNMAGYLLPRIAEQTPDAAGYIFLAASARPQEDLLLEQTAYILSTEKNLDEASKTKIMEQTEATVSNIKTLTAGSTLPASALYNLPASYWLDLQSYQPLQQVQKIEHPLLFLQGGRDYQVSTTDYQLWQSALDETKDVHFLYYDNLNHLFMSGTGKSTPAEYEQKGVFSSQVSDDIAQFIKNHCEP